MKNKIWQVGEINSALKELIENSLLPLWVQAEVGTLNIHGSGHVYLTLKDRRSQLRAVFFNGAAQARQLRLKVGDQVEVFGKLTVYEVRGEYQLSIRQMRPLGMGDLQRRFEELKRKLEAEGLFEPARKKPIPLLPETIGLVTAPGGAAVRDFLQIIERRFPNLHIRIYPSPVQGFGAEHDLSAGIEFFNRSGGADVIVLTRGGGSMEDLWPFNAEVLARAVAASKIPVISAVGHEIDFTIADFVADMRVPTPSAAAELVVGRREEFEKELGRRIKDLKAALQFRFQELKSRLRIASESHVFREPGHFVRQKQQYLDELMRNLSIPLERSMQGCDSRLQLLAARLKSLLPRENLLGKRRQLEQLTAILQSGGRSYYRLLQATLAGIDGRLEALNPENVLKRGYAILRDGESGETITDPVQPSGKEIQATLSKGTVKLIVK
ncbi:MAG: exodeoxyribonuclease VII large subunit [Victivallales bacterium]|nr:exodeoxyribonuclease VII large subunit [Victivallales bacterium]